MRNQSPLYFGGKSKSNIIDLETFEDINVYSNFILLKDIGKNIIEHFNHWIRILFLFSYLIGTIVVNLFIDIFLQAIFYINYDHL